MTLITPFVIPRIKEIIIPEIKEMPTNVENLIKEGKYCPGDVYLLPENVGFWFDENRKNRSLQEFGWPTAIYSRKVSPYNRLDKRFLVAEMYFNGEDHEITTHFNNEGNKESFNKFKMRGQFSESKMSKLFAMIEEKYDTVLETKKESDELRESFEFGKFIDDIVIREEKAKEEQERLAKAEEFNYTKKWATFRKTNVYGKVGWKKK